MNKYLEMKKEREKSLNKLPFFAAFSKKDFEEGLKKVGGLKPGEKVIMICNGVFIKKSDYPKFKKHREKSNKLMEEGLKDPEFAYDAFYYELGNHEFFLSYNDPRDTLESLGLTEEEVNNNEVLKNAFKKAKHDYLKYCRENC